MSEPNTSDELIAFLLVCGAGLSTALGASFVFFPKLVTLTSHKTLAGALGASAGVMLYVSFVEIFVKSHSSFADAGYEDQTAYMLATSCFFAGCLLMMLLDRVVHSLAVGKHAHNIPHVHEVACDKEDTASPSIIDHAPSLDEHRENEVEGTEVAHCVGCSADPCKELDNWKHNAEAEMKSADNAAAIYTLEEGTKAKTVDQSSTTTVGTSDMNADDHKLMNMGLQTALAIGLHNFPEGLATFVASVNDPKVGAVLAVAIGIHNIPEGICVSLPIYYATGNRVKAFMWALLSGISEPIAALLGWAILANVFSDEIYAVLFGLVSGMMITITMKELIPTAHRYDKDDSVVTYSVLAVLAVMAVSLILFASG